jgi:zinc protease
MDDLSAASLEDVSAFFRKFYAPNNAVLVVTGDVDADRIKAQVERFFGWIPRGNPVAKPDLPIPPIPETRHITLEDRVTLPQVSLMWRTGKAFSPDDAALSALAAILTDGKNSRLYNRLVYDEQVAQSVTAFNDSQLLSGDFYIQVMGKEDMDLDRLEAAVLEEVGRIAAEPPSAEELQRVQASVETGLIGGLQTLSSRADQLNSYFYYTGDPDHAAEHLAAYRALTPASIQRVARDYLADRNHIVISIVPTGRGDLAATEEAR